MKLGFLIILSFLTFSTQTFGFVSEIKELWGAFGEGLDKAKAFQEVVLDVNEMKKLLEKLNILEEGTLSELDDLSTQLDVINRGSEIYEDIPGYVLDKVPSHIYETRELLKQLSLKQSKYSDNDVYYNFSHWANSKIKEFEDNINESDKDILTSEETLEKIASIDEIKNKMKDGDPQSLRNAQLGMSTETLKVMYQNLELQQKLLVEAKENNNQKRIEDLEKQIESKKIEMVYFKNDKTSNGPMSDIFRSFFR